MHGENIIEHVIEDIIIAMASGTGLDCNIQEEDIVEDTNAKCHFCTHLVTL